MVLSDGDVREYSSIVNVANKNKRVSLKVTIPVEIVEEFGLVAGDVFVWSVVGEGVGGRKCLRVVARRSKFVDL